MFAYEKSEFILLDIWPFISVSESWRLLMSGKQYSTDQIQDVSEPIEVSNKCIAVRKVATPLRELTCHIGSHSVTCHPAEVTFPPLPLPKLVLD